MIVVYSVKEKKINNFISDTNVKLKNNENYIYFNITDPVFLSDLKNGMCKINENGERVELENSEIAEKETKHFQNAVNSKYFEISSKREQMIYDKFTFKGEEFACDKEAREDIQDVERAYNYAVKTETEYIGRYWYVYGGGRVVFIEANDILDFCVQPSYVKDQAWDKYIQLSTQLKQATTLEEVEAVKWDA